MPGTTLTDIIVPELFNPYVIQKTMENRHSSAAVSSHAMQHLMRWRVKRLALIICRSLKIFPEMRKTS